MTHRILFFCLCMTVTVFAQGPLTTEPHLSLAFPFAEKSGVVGLKHSVAISPTAIVPSDAVLRVIYVPPKAGDNEVRNAELNSQEHREVAFSKIQHLENTAEKLTPVQAATQKITKETAWPSVTMFQLALANLNSQDLHLVYMNTKTMKIVDEPISLPFGLLLAEVEGVITVLAVEKGSAGEQATLAAGDQILKIADSPLSGNLLQCLDLLRQAKQSAEVQTDRVIPLLVKNPKDGAERNTQLKLPISLKSSLLDSPLDDLSYEKEKPEVPLYKSSSSN